MFSDESPDSEFWCPLGKEHASTGVDAVPEISPADHASLSRLAAGDWLSDAQIAHLEELGLVERVFGHALLTRLGRTALQVDL